MHRARSVPAACLRPIERVGDAVPFSISVTEDRQKNDDDGYRGSMPRAGGLSICVRENPEDDTPASHLRKNLRQPALDYERVTRSFFAISMERDGTIFYSRCNFSARRSTIHCFDLVYPQSEKKAWDPVVTRISLSLRPLER